MNEPLAAMFRYSAWANRTLLEACRSLGTEVLGYRGTGCSGSVGELLTHILGGEQTFVLRTKGRQHEGELNRRSAFPGIDELARISGETGTELIAIAASLETERDVQLPYMGRVHRIPLSFFLVHALEHGVEHRTEVKVALGALGIASPDLDGWAYAAATGIGRQV